MKHFLCHDAFVQTIRACCDPYFFNLMRLLKGNAFGWEADVERHEEPVDKPDVDPSNDYIDRNMETQYINYSDDEHSRDMEPDEYIPDEAFILPSGATNKSPGSGNRETPAIQLHSPTLPENAPILEDEDKKTAGTICPGEAVSEILLLHDLSKNKG